MYTYVCILYARSNILVGGEGEGFGGVSRYLRQLSVDGLLDPLDLLEELVELVNVLLVVVHFYQPSPLSYLFDLKITQ